MAHDLPEWFDLDRRLARLQEIPVLLQFRTVDFRPGLHESPLRYRQATSQALDGIHREDRRFILVVRVKMCAVMLHAGFDKHPDNNPEEPR
jgi:hypothetical protein